MFYSQTMNDSRNAKKMWDSINLIINKKRPSSRIDKIKQKN